MFAASMLSRNGTTAAAPVAAAVAELPVADAIVVLEEPPNKATAGRAHPMAPRRPKVGARVLLKESMIDSGKSLLELSANASRSRGVRKEKERLHYFVCLVRCHQALIKQVPKGVKGMHLDSTQGVHERSIRRKGVPTDSRLLYAPPLRPRIEVRGLLHFILGLRSESYQGIVVAQIGHGSRNR